MIIFHPEKFKLNKNFDVKKIKTSSDTFFIVENFYEDFDLVLDEIKKLPISLVWTKSGQEQLKNTIIDGRKTYVSNMIGTELPYIKDLPQKIKNFLNVRKEQIEIPKSLIINCCKKLEKYPDNEYYNIHYDKKIHNHLENQYSIIIFLNEKYEDETVGLNIYDSNKKYLKKNDFFVDHKELDIIHFVKAKPNRAIIIPHTTLHGQENGNGSQFYNDWRHTQIIFIPIHQLSNIKFDKRLQYT